MQKDYIDTPKSNQTENEFVESYWSMKWEAVDFKANTERVFRQAEYKILSKYLPSNKEHFSILDGGCGLGEWVIALEQQNYDVTGVDISAVTIAALELLKSRSNFITGDIRSLPFPSNYFNLYFSWGVFEHFEAGPQDCLREAFRVIQADGILVISVPFFNLRHAAASVFGKNLIFPSNQRFYQYRYTRQEIAKELVIAGFDILDVHLIHKKSGCLRFLHHSLGLPYRWVLTRILANFLSYLVPGFLLAHMVLIVARKRNGSNEIRG